MPKVIEIPAPRKVKVDPIEVLRDSGKCPECMGRNAFVGRVCLCSAHWVSLALRGQMVLISTLKFDPQNARLHPDENMTAIKLSLLRYGQLKPIVVRKENRTVMAGNGTMRAAQELGFASIAANIVPMTDAEALGYALADNRTAELAKWDVEVQAKCAILHEQLTGELPPGYTVFNLDGMRAILEANGHYAQQEGSGSNLSNVWNVLVECGSEEKQMALINEMMERGYSCRALTF